MSGYRKIDEAQGFLRFLGSPDGTVQQTAVRSAVFAGLGNVAGARVLDLGCGNGWLAAELSAKGAKVSGCDASEALLAEARAKNPGIDFKVADLEGPLPYPDGTFGAVTATLSLQDVADQPRAYREAYRVLNPGGRLVVFASNPYYAFPVGVWKRPWWGKLVPSWVLPRLQLRAYGDLMNGDRSFDWGNGIPSRFTTLPEQLNAAAAAGFAFEKMTDVAWPPGEKRWGRAYQLSRFPLYIFLTYKKPA